MLERLVENINDPSESKIDWVKSPDQIVEGVEAVFSAVKDQADRERDLLEELFDWFQRAAALAGTAFELPIIMGIVAGFAPFAAIGAGYMDAVDEIKRTTSPMAFAEGVVMGVMAESPEFIRDQFWINNPPNNPLVPQGGKVKQYYNNGALVLGYLYGKELQGELTPVFWSDLKRVDDQTLIQHGDPGEENWGPKDWRNFYIRVASAFMKLHVRGS